MRSLFLPDIEFIPNTTLKVEGADFVHLNKVLRVKEGDEILVLDGLGSKIQAKIELVDKRHLTLVLETKEKLEKKYSLDLYLGMPKKEYFEDIVRSCVELGVRNIIPVASKYSQSPKINLERASKIIKGSMEQSNNPWATIVKDQISWNEFLERDLDWSRLVYYNPIKSSDVIEWSKDEPLSILIGPEGGFSKEEVANLRQKAAKFVSLPSPILRSVTAVPAAIGHSLGFLN